MFKQQKLRQQAGIDYQQARGTAHKVLLQKARTSLVRQRTAYMDSIQTAQKETLRLKTIRDQKLKDALVHYLVHERLTDIPGIGASRKADILRNIYKGQLMDLHRAHLLPGIGEQTQAAINEWVRNQQINLSRLLQENFPGRQPIDSWYHHTLLAKEQEVATARKHLVPIEKHIDVIETKLLWLEKISKNDFYKALKNPDTASPELNDYIQGVFGEWEPVPQWFRDGLAQADGDRQNITSRKTIETDGQSTSPSNAKENQHFGYIAAVVAVVILGCSAFFAALPSTPDDQITPAVTLTTMKPTPLPATATAWPSATAVQPTVTTIPSRTPTATATVKPTGTATAVPQPQVRVISGAVNVRATPDTSAAVVGIARGGEILPVLQVNEAETWFLVELPDGSKGWIGSSVVTRFTDNAESP